MSKKEDYARRNTEFLEALRGEAGVMELPCGVLCRVLTSAGGDRHPNIRSVVSVHYTGTLINGRVFDDTRRSKTPAAFRLKDVITGWQIALTRMAPGDRWQIYIPAHAGYGDRRTGEIPANSTLVFDVELLGIA